MTNSLSNTPLANLNSRMLAEVIDVLGVGHDYDVQGVANGFSAIAERYAEELLELLDFMCEGCADVEVKEDGDFCEECRTEMREDSYKEDPAKSHGRGQ